MSDPLPLKNKEMTLVDLHIIQIRLTYRLVNPASTSVKVSDIAEYLHGYNRIQNPAGYVYSLS